MAVASSLLATAAGGSLREVMGLGGHSTTGAACATSTS
jgi:hypothetical protein